MARLMCQQFDLVVSRVSLNQLPDRSHRVRGALDVLGEDPIVVLQVARDAAITVGCIGMREQVKKVKVPEI